MALLLALLFIGELSQQSLLIKYLLSNKNYYFVLKRILKSFSSRFLFFQLISHFYLLVTLIYVGYKNKYINNLKFKMKL